MDDVNRAPLAEVLPVRFCPYSRETVAGCAFYEPVSQHGSHTGAELCRFALQSNDGSPVRSIRCVRGTRTASASEVNGRPV